MALPVCILLTQEQDGAGWRRLVGDVTAAANLFGFFGSLTGPVAFALVARQTASFDTPYLLIAGQLIVFGVFCLWHRR